MEARGSFAYFHACKLCSFQPFWDFQDLNLQGDQAIETLVYRHRITSAFLSSANPTMGNSQTKTACVIVAAEASLQVT